jgi:hypothetical protein
MGYTTEFNGRLSLSRQLSLDETDFINKFSETRRMKRDSEKLFVKYNGKYGRILNENEEKSPITCYGKDGEFFIGDDESTGVIDYNSHGSQPGLWCQWVIEENTLCWDGNEKFYYYTEWLEYLIEYFFNPWGVILNGVIKWSGEDFSDLGIITVDNNVVVSNNMEF